MPRFAANLTMMYTEHGFLVRFAAAARDGFTAVEYLFPYDYPAATLAASISEAAPATTRNWRIRVLRCMKSPLIESIAPRCQESIDTENGLASRSQPHR